MRQAKRSQQQARERAIVTKEHQEMLEFQKEQRKADEERRVSNLFRKTTTKTERAASAKHEATKQGIVESIAYHMVKQRNLVDNRNRMSQLEWKHNTKTLQELDKGLEKAA